jgi:transketolase
MTASKMEQLCINTIRTLAIDAIQKAKSGACGVGF